MRAGLWRRVAQTRTQTTTTQGQRRKAADDDGGATDSIDERTTGNDKGGRLGLCTRAGRGNQVALRADHGSARMALAALCADEDTDNGGARPSNDGNGGATNSVDKLMTGDDKDRQSGLRTRAG